jgi:DNA-directed RNA polymerase specialized sigma24 family protein
MGESASLIAQPVSKDRILEMRFFGGLSIEDTAEVIGVSRTTVKRDWATARAWPLREMSRREERA